MTRFADTHLKPVPTNGGAPAFDTITGERLEPLERLQRALTTFGAPGHLVAGITKRGRQKAAYDLRLADGQTVELGDAHAVLTPRTVRARIFDATGEVMDTVKTDDWRPVAQLIAAVAVVQNSAMSDLDEARYWIASFVEQVGRGLVKCVDLDDREQYADALGGGQRRQSGARDRGLVMFTGSDDRLYLRQSAFYQHVKDGLRENAKTTEIAERLGRLGFERKQPSLRDGDKVHKQRMFVSAPGFDPEA
jgi:hypothetical protein